jgi:hypothetical protein
MHVRVKTVLEHEEFSDGFKCDFVRPLFLP